MRILFFMWCVTLCSFNSYSQKVTQLERTVYSSYEKYLEGITYKMVCRVAKRKIEGVSYLNIKNKTDSVVDVWGISFEDKVWIKDKRKNKFYELKEDSLGLYYDLYNDDANMIVLASAFGFGLVGGIIAQE